MSAVALFAMAALLLAIGTCVLILCVGSVGAVQFPAEASTSEHDEGISA
jgi:hypothetical protein